MANAVGFVSDLKLFLRDEVLCVVVIRLDAEARSRINLRFVIKGH